MIAIRSTRAVLIVALAGVLLIALGLAGAASAQTPNPEDCDIYTGEGCVILSEPAPPEPVTPQAPATPAPTCDFPGNGSPGVSINDGAAFVNDRDVTISVDWTGCPTSMSVSNDGGFVNAPSFLPAHSIPWTLSDPLDLIQPQKTVYVSVGGTTLTDDVVLDTADPVITSASFANPVGKASISVAGRTVKLKAKDSLSGVRTAQFAKTRRPNVIVQRNYKRKVSAPSQARFVRVLDNAGNRSSWSKIKP